MSEQSRVKSEELVDKRFLGVPYKLGGNTLEGCDCIGLAIQWFKQFGIEYQYDDKQGPVLAHWWQTNPRRFANAMLQVGDMITFSDVKKYDVLMFFLGVQTDFPSCLGVMVDSRHMLITLEERGSFVTILDQFWKDKFFGAMRLKKVIESRLE